MPRSSFHSVVAPVCLALGLLLSAHAVGAQTPGIPRTATLPGLPSPVFPYAEPEEVGLSSEKLAQLGDEIVEWVANGELVGAELLIVKDGRAVFHEAYGWSDREEGRPMERGSLFSIKSMSKPFTAMAILMLAEEGELSLDDPVTRYVPTFAGDERTTVRHLLAHTSGYAGLGFDVDGFDTLERWVADWASRPPDRPFGTFSYSDFNYAALGRIVESVSGVAPDSFIEERIIRPLGLQETYTSVTPDVPWAARANTRYQWSDEAGDYERYWSHRDHPGWVFYPAAWGLWATAMDYAEFMTVWLNGGEYEGTRLLAEETVEEALRPHGLIHGRGVYGYGWHLETDPGSGEMPLIFRHGGYDGTLAMAFPADDALVVYLTQTRGAPSPRDSHRDVLRNRLSLSGLFEYPAVGMVSAADAGVEPIELSPAERARYVGTYRGRPPGGEGAPEMVARVWDEGGHLHAGIGPLGVTTDMRFHLVPLGDHRFAHGQYRGDRLEAVAEGIATEFQVDGGEATWYNIFVDDQPSAVMQLARAVPEQVRTHADAGRIRLAVDELVEAYPEVAKPSDSLSDAYAAAGQPEEARRSYARAVEMTVDTSSPATDPETSLADSILALTHDLAGAWKRLDPDDYLGRFSNDLIFHFDGRTVSRAEFEAVVRQSMASLQSSTFEVLDPEVEVLGPDAAVVSFGLREEMVDRSGGVTDLHAALTLVFERRGGEWLIVRAHESLFRSPIGVAPRERGYLLGSPLLEQAVRPTRCPRSRIEEFLS